VAFGVCSPGEVFRRPIIWKISAPEPKSANNESRPRPRGERKLGGTTGGTAAVGGIITVSGMGGAPMIGGKGATIGIGAGVMGSGIGRTTGGTIGLFAKRGTPGSSFSSLRRLIEGSNCTVFSFC
jgi:hypothetical protein